MALVLPIFASENTLLVTENDLGRGFSVDNNGANAKKSNVFICTPEDMTTVRSITDSNKLTLINDQESLTSALNVGGGELEGSVDINKLSVRVKGQMNKQDGSSKSKTNVTSPACMSGCKDLKKVHIQRLDEANQLIEAFEVNKNALVPVRMKISQIPANLTPSLSIDSIQFNNYKKKLSDVGKTYLQLDVFKQLIQPMLEDDNAEYIEDLYPKVVECISLLKSSQDKLIGSMQGAMNNILTNEIPVYEADAELKKSDAKQMIGTSFTKTEVGRWKGPTVNKIPTYKGTYNYNDGSEYEGLCLNGKRHGKGIKTYYDGNPDEFKSIDVTYSNDKPVVTITGAKDFKKEETSLYFMFSNFSSIWSFI
ncbi:hypothetical protein ACTFIU_006537 [Dictyostelium citrinum]